MNSEDQDDILDHSVGSEDNDDKAFGDNIPLINFDSVPIHINPRSQENRNNQRNEDLSHIEQSNESPSLINRSLETLSQFKNNVIGFFRGVGERINNLFSGQNNENHNSILSYLDRLLLAIGEVVHFLISLEISFCGAFKLRFIIVAVIMLLPSLIFGWQNFLISLAIVMLLFVLALYQKRQASQNTFQSNPIQSNSNTNYTSSQPSTQSSTNQNSRIHSFSSRSGETTSSPPRRLGGSNIRTFSDINRSSP